MKYPRIYLYKKKNRLKIHLYLFFLLVELKTLYSNYCLKVFLESVADRPVEKPEFFQWVPVLNYIRGPQLQHYPRFLPEP